MATINRTPFHGEKGLFPKIESESAFQINSLGNLPAQRIYAIEKIYHKKFGWLTKEEWTKYNTPLGEAMYGR